MAHDVFISYSSKDKPIADAVCANMEVAGIRCWIAPRDIAPGEDWPTAITTAISKSRVMVLIFSANSNSSEDVGRELMLAANSKLVIIPFKIENIEPEPGKQYYLARTHWLDAMNPPTQEQIAILVHRVTSILPATDTITPIKVKPVPEQLTPPPAKPAPTKKRANLWPLWIGLALVVLGAIAWIVFSRVLNPFTAARVQTPTYSMATRTFMNLDSLTPSSIIAAPLDVSSMTGAWSGTAVNGNTQMQITITVLSTCKVNQVCAYFNNASLPCAGDFAFLQMTDGMYEFKAMNTIGSCGPAQDFLQPQPDGTLLYRSTGDFGETRGILQKSNGHEFSADFNDPIFDGKFDASVWTKSSNTNTLIKQANGAMVFSKENASGGTLDKLNTNQFWTLDELNYAEARLMLDQNYTGDQGQGNVAITLAGPGTWWAGCSISIGDPTPYISCGQGDAQQTDYMSNSYYVEYGKWYTVRLKFNLQTNGFEGYIDGSPFYSWQPANIDEIMKGNMRVSIGLWTNDGTSITGSVDDVRVGK